MTDLPFALRVRGCLLGGAVGDALAQPVDRLSLGEIRGRFPPDGLRNFWVFGENQRAPVSAITQRILFTTEGLIRAWVAGESRGVGHPPSVVAAAYRRWLRTQGIPRREVPADRVLWQSSDGWLVREPWLHSRRTKDPLAAAGGALLRAHGGPIDHPENLGPPTDDPGALTHIAPVGLLPYAGPTEDVDEPDTRSAIYRLATEIAATTHAHPEAQEPAALLATTLWGLVHANESIDQAFDNARNASRAVRFESREAEQSGPSNAGLPKRRPLEIRACTPTPAAPPPTSPHAPTLTEILYTTTHLRIGSQPDWNADLVSSLSRNRTASEVLVTALLIARSHPSRNQLGRALLLAANHSGASCAVASVTAQLLGAIHGEKALPPTWLFHLEKAETIARLAEDFARQMSGAAPVALDTWGPFTPDWLDRYPPC